MIEALLGAGGMGEVFRATDTRLGRTVAIKVLAAQVAVREELRRRFEVEARAIATLNHPHICALFDVGQQGDLAYMVMEHLDGEPLAARLRKGPLPLADALRYGVQIAQALEQAHRRGIVHRSGERIVYAKAGVESTGNVIVRDASGAGQEVVMSRGGMASDWSRDGRYILFGPSPGATELAIWAQPLADPARVITVLKGDATGLLLAFSARLSPDGRWVAYVSNEGGTPDVYVTPFPSAEGKWPISTDGGSQPRWRDDGKELFYVAKDGSLMAVSVSTSARFHAGAPVPLFALRGVEFFGTRYDYAPTRGGQRFLVNVGLSTLDSNRLTVIDGWQSGLAR